VRFFALQKIARQKRDSLKNKIKVSRRVARICECKSAQQKTSAQENRNMTNMRAGAKRPPAKSIASIWEHVSQMRATISGGAHEGAKPLRVI